MKIEKLKNVYFLQQSLRQKSKIFAIPFTQIFYADISITVSFVLFAQTSRQRLYKPFCITKQKDIADFPWKISVGGKRKDKSVALARKILSFRFPTTRGTRAMDFSIPPKAAVKLGISCEADGKFLRSFFQKATNKSHSN